MVRGVSPSRDSSMFWRLWVIRMGLPMGRQPWATTVSMVMLPCRATPAAPERCTRLPRKRALPFCCWPPLASPPILAAPEKAKSRPIKRFCTGKVKGSARMTNWGASEGLTFSSSSQDEGPRVQVGEGIAGEVKWRERNVGKGSRRDGKGRALFHLLAVADYAATGATQDHRGIPCAAQGLPDKVGDGLVVAAVMG